MCRFRSPLAHPGLTPQRPRLSPRPAIVIPRVAPLRNCHRLRVATTLCLRPRPRISDRPPCYIPPVRPYRPVDCSLSHTHPCALSSSHAIFSLPTAPPGFRPLSASRTPTHHILPESSAVLLPLASPHLPLSLVTFALNVIAESPFASRWLFRLPSRPVSTCPPPPAARSALHFLSRSLQRRYFSWDLLLATDPPSPLNCPTPSWAPALFCPWPSFRRCDLLPAFRFCFAVSQFCRRP